MTAGIQSAIHDETLTTVGGSVYSVIMDKEGEVKMHVNGISEDIL